MVLNVVFIGMCISNIHNYMDCLTCVSFLVKDSYFSMYRAFGYIGAFGDFSDAYCKSGNFSLCLLNI